MTSEQFAGVLRHALGAVGTYMAARGIVGAGEWETFAGAAMTAGMAVWSWRAKRAR